MSKKKIITTPDKYQLNGVSDSPDIRDRMYEPALIQLKTHLDPKPYSMTILDQGREGACTGFGLSAVINYLNKERDNSFRSSPRMLYEMAKRHDEWPGEGYDGSSCRGAIRGWYSMGVCGEKDWPYAAGTEGTLTVKRAKAARANTIGAYYRLRPNIVDFHAALNEAGILYVSADVHAGWWKSSLVKNENGNKEIPYNKDEVQGGHAFCIVGYNQRGFWVQNSWGESWGKSGIALWLYEDWQDNVKDAWVVRLALSTPQIWQRPVVSEPGATGDREGLFRAPNRAQIAGHFVHVDDGGFHENGRYWSTRADVKQTAKLLKATTEYKHVLLYAHGGLNDVSASAKRISSMKDVFKANGIYPYHFMYDTGLMEEVKDVVLRKKSGTESRIAGFSDWWDKRVEKLTQKPGRALWREMKMGASKPFDANMAGAHVLTDLVGAVASNSRLGLHLAGHSTGAILMANLIECADSIFPKGLPVSSLSLLAPACTTQLFDSHYRPHLKGSAAVKIKNAAVYNLSKKLEKDDTVAYVYRKSLLYLVSRAFEENPVAPILGMEKYSGAIKEKNLEFVYSQGQVDISPRTTSETHGGFDNDPATMNDMLSRILKGKPVRPFTKEDLDY
jgi:hypothetical protein